MEIEPRQPWKLSVIKLAEAYRVDIVRGLTTTEAEQRLVRHGRNQLTEAGGPGPWSMFFSQFKNVIIWVLIGAAAVSGFMREWVDTIAIVAIVILNAILGFIQEYRAEKTLAALHKLSNPATRVIRDGALQSIPSGTLVPGDLVELEAGDHVPADGRVVRHSANFAVQEASLTGESTPVSKQSNALEGDDISLADRVNSVFMGTTVVAGKARLLVNTTGMKTELGHIAGMIQSVEAETTPLQKKLDQFGSLLVKICFVLVALVFVLLWWRKDWQVAALGEIILTAVSLAVAAIPEGLPAVVTIALALGVQRMVKRHALIRKLPSVETLGCATVICSDKTGTLTRNEMTVQAIFADHTLYRVNGIGYEPRGTITLDGTTINPHDHTVLLEGLRCGVLCNGARLAGSPGQPYSIVGDPTEGALLTAAVKAGIQLAPLNDEHPVVDELPFDSDRKMMTVIRRSVADLRTAYVKGAPDILLNHCTRIATKDGTRELTDDDRSAIRKANNDLTGEAMRVLAVGHRTLEQIPDVISPATIERDLVFVALTAMIDPPRDEVRAAMQTCRTAGIRTVMITGDHKNTAAAIARDLGMIAEGDRALSGAELDLISDDELTRQIEHIPVYARVSPEHKLRIVKAWRRKGHVTAMTGDGVNDAPAVKEADIGIAMGITGTDVTKEVSDMIVTDDNFASIVAAVEEGRGIYDNILKFVRYLLSCNAGEILVMVIAAVVGMPVPLLPMHILWVNLVTDGLPALALGMEPVDEHIMHRPPRSGSNAIIDRRTGLILIGQGLCIALCSLGAFSFVLYGQGGTLAQARTAAFMTLACSQLVHAFNFRHAEKSLFTLGLFTNMKLVGATFISLILQLAVVEIPFFRVFFKTENLTWSEWGAVAVIATFPFWMMEIVKIFLRRREDNVSGRDRLQTAA